jgi:hypothetical protein
MKNSLAFKYRTDLSRELDGTGVKIDGEIRVEIVERSTAHRIAEDFTMILDIISGSDDQKRRAGSGSRRLFLPDNFPA